MVGLEALYATFIGLNNSKMFWGIALIMMNLGSRFVIGDINKVHEKILMMDLIKKVVLFCMFFVGSRDVIIALILTFAFSIVINGLLNSKSRFSMLPREFQNTVLVTDPEYLKAKEIIARFESTKEPMPKKEGFSEPIDNALVYKSNLSKMAEKTYL